MTRRRLRAVVPAGLLVLWVLLPLPARAATPTALELETTSLIAVGVHPTVTVRLTDPAGPIVGVVIEIRLDGRQTERVITDADGGATTDLARDLESGDHEVQAVFRGTPSLLASDSLAVNVRVVPARLTIRTVPPVAGVGLLRVDGGPVLTTDANGTVTVSIARVRRYELEIMLPPRDPDRRITFDRWGDGSREPMRSIRLPGRTDIVIGLEISHPVVFGFIDTTGAAVDPARIETFLVASDRGEALEPGAAEPAWLTGNRVVRRPDGLTSIPIEYRIQEVGVRGSNVVDRGRLHFQPDGGISTWVIPLLLHSLTITGQDALFGYPVGSSVRLEYPDGTVERVPLDDRAAAAISALPRGNYRAVIEQPPGIAVSTPIVLSRDQQVRVPVISYLDAAVVLGAGLALAVGLVVFGGRPIGRLGRRSAPRLAGAGRPATPFPATVPRLLTAVVAPAAPSIAPAAPSIAPAAPSIAPAAPIAPSGVASVEPSNEGLTSRSVQRDTDRWGRSIERERRHRHCPDCSNRLTYRARLCRVCGRRVRRS